MSSSCQWVSTFEEKISGRKYFSIFLFTLSTQKIFQVNTAKIHTTWKQWWKALESLRISTLNIIKLKRRAKWGKEEEKNEIHENYYGIEAFRNSQKKKSSLIFLPSRHSAHIRRLVVESIDPKKISRREDEKYTQQIYDESFRLGFIILWIFFSTVPFAV